MTTHRFTVDSEPRDGDRDRRLRMPSGNTLPIAHVTDADALTEALARGQDWPTAAEHPPTDDEATFLRVWEAVEAVDYPPEDDPPSDRTIRRCDLSWRTISARSEAHTVAGSPVLPIGRADSGGVIMTDRRAHGESEGDDGVGPAVSTLDTRPVPRVGRRRSPMAALERPFTFAGEIVDESEAEAFDPPALASEVISFTAGLERIASAERAAAADTDLIHLR